MQNIFSLRRSWQRDYCSCNASCAGTNQRIVARRATLDSTEHESQPVSKQEHFGASRVMRAVCYQIRRCSGEGPSSPPMPKVKRHFFIVDDEDTASCGVMRSTSERPWEMSRPRKALSAIQIEKRTCKGEIGKEGLNAFKGRFKSCITASLVPCGQKQHAEHEGSGSFDQNASFLLLSRFL